LSNFRIKEKERKKQDAEAIRKAVRERYGAIAMEGKARPQTCSSFSCCSPSPGLADLGKFVGYTDDQLESVPEGANMGLSCGNPVAIAGLMTGERVVDLGSGGGFDCFQAAEKVGPTGHVIGVDMTPEMVARARENISKGPFANVEFRLGEIEHLPVADESADAILSNCVVNLSPDKPQVFRDAFRVLRPGGRLSISDIISISPMPEALRNDLELMAGCVAGAAAIQELEAMLRDAGFQDIRVVPIEESKELIRRWAPGRDMDKYILPATIEARKPAGGSKPRGGGVASHENNRNSS